MLRHAPPLPPQISHWYENDIGVEPRQLPGLAVSVLPTCMSPLIVGREALEGAEADVAVAAETATRPATAATNGTRRIHFIIDLLEKLVHEGSPRASRSKRRFTPP